jgi:hypothetical protein
VQIVEKKGRVRGCPVVKADTPSQLREHTVVSLLEAMSTQCRTNLARGHRDISRPSAFPARPPAPTRVCRRRRITRTRTIYGKRDVGYVFTVEHLDPFLNLGTVSWGNEI